MKTMVGGIITSITFGGVQDLDYMDIELSSMPGVRLKSFTPDRTLEVGSHLLCEGRWLGRSVIQIFNK